MQWNIKHLEGQQFGRLVVVSRASHNKRQEPRWNCLCACGKETVVVQDSLLTNKTTSCGCARHFKTIEEAKQYRISPETSALRDLYTRYSKRAKNRNLVFHLTISDFERLIKGNCRYCGSAPSRLHVPTKASRCSIKCNGIDRVENSLGYLPNNCAPCCPICNYMKGKMTTESFLFQCKKILNFDAKTDDGAEVEVINRERELA